MHKEVLSEKQTELFPQLTAFSGEFSLVGGTAVALQLGHRQSIDFDLASKKEIHSPAIRKKLLKLGKIDAVILDNEDEYSLIIDGVKFTFFNYPFPIDFSQDLAGVIFSPDLISLAAMKAYALGRRAKWKDYVDLYFILKKLGSIQPVVGKANDIFGKEFNEKNFRSQLAYFQDLDYSEKVFFSPGFETDDEEIKKKLREFSLE